MDPVSPKQKSVAAKMKTPSKKHEDHEVIYRKPLVKPTMTMEELDKRTAALKGSKISNGLKALRSLEEKANENERLLNEQKTINEQLELDLVHKKEEVLKLTSELNDLRTQGNQPIPSYAQNRSLARKEPTPSDACEHTCELDFYKQELRKQDNKIKYLKDFEYESNLLKNKLTAKQLKIDELQRQLRRAKHNPTRSHMGHSEQARNILSTHSQKNPKTEQSKNESDEEVVTIESLKEELETKNAQVANLLEMIEVGEQRLLNEYQYKDKEIELLRGQLFRAEQTNLHNTNVAAHDLQRSLCRKNDKLKNQMQAHKESNAQLRKQLALSNENAKEKVEELEAQLEAKNLEIEQLRKKTQQTPDVYTTLKVTLDAVMADSRSQVRDMENRFKMEMQCLQEKNRQEFGKIRMDIKELKMSSKSIPDDESSDWRRPKRNNSGNPRTSDVPREPYVPPHLRYTKCPLVRVPKPEQQIEKVGDVHKLSEFILPLENDIEQFMRKVAADSTKLAEFSRPNPTKSTVMKGSEAVTTSVKGEHSKVGELASESNENIQKAKTNPWESGESDSESIEDLQKAESSKSSFSDISFSSDESWIMPPGCTPDRASPEF